MKQEKLNQNCKISFHSIIGEMIYDFKIYYDNATRYYFRDNQNNIIELFIHDDVDQQMLWTTKKGNEIIKFDAKQNNNNNASLSQQENVQNYQNYYNDSSHFNDEQKQNVLQAINNSARLRQKLKEWYNFQQNNLKQNAKVDDFILSYQCKYSHLTDEQSLVFNMQYKEGEIPLYIILNKDGILYTVPQNNNEKYAQNKNYGYFLVNENEQLYWLNQYDFSISYEENCNLNVCIEICNEFFRHTPQPNKINSDVLLINLYYMYKKQYCNDQEGFSSAVKTQYFNHLNAYECNKVTKVTDEIWQNLKQMNENGHLNEKYILNDESNLLKRLVCILVRILHLEQYIPTSLSFVHRGTIRHQITNLENMLF